MPRSRLLWGFLNCNHSWHDSFFLPSRAILAPSICETAWTTPREFILVGANGDDARPHAGANGCGLDDFDRGQHILSLEWNGAKEKPG